MGDHQDFKTIVWNKKKSVSRVHNQEGSSKFRNLDGDDPNAPLNIKHNVRAKIQMGRTAKIMSQKELAMKINVPTSTINAYESGKAIPDKGILRKIGNALGIKL
jgi:ribosome-binding protein aMBF1 (putative translation factor)